MAPKIVCIELTLKQNESTFWARRSLRTAFVEIGLKGSPY